MDWKRPSCHEAGHAVVGLHLNFNIEGIEVFEGRLRVMCQLDCGDRTDDERFVFLAGGIAGEKSEIGGYYSGGCKDDQAKISERGGKSIEVYLPEATRIIQSNRKCFDEMRKQIVIRAIEGSAVMSIARGKNLCKLLSGDELRLIWQLTHNA